MNAMWRLLRGNPLLWLLVFVPVVLVVEHARPEAGMALFVLSVLAIVPLAALLSLATEAVAAKTGDTVGGLLNATLGNLTELVIALTALQAGQITLVKASIAGVIVANALFMLGMSFLLGGLRHHAQEFNAASALLSPYRFSMCRQMPAFWARAWNHSLNSSVSISPSLGLGIVTFQIR